MKWFMDMKLATKLILAFVVVLALTAFLGIFAIQKLAAVRATTVDMTDNWMPAIHALDNIQFDLSAIRRGTMRIGLSKNTDQVEAGLQTISQGHDLLKKHRAIYEATITGSEERALWEKAATATENFEKEADQDVELARAGKVAEATERLLGPEFVAFNEANAALAEDITFQEKGADAAGKASADLYSTARVWVIGILVACVLLGLLLAVLIAKLISRPVVEVGAVAKSIAAGDLTGVDIAVKSKDEVGELGRSINEMHRSMRDMIQSIASAAYQVGTSSQDVSTTSQQIAANSHETSAQVATVSAATEEVNRNLQTVATATEEMSATVQEIAKNASEAAKIAAEAMKAAAETNAVVSKLGDSSAEIGQVIKVITSIAQKTDLLALNATVEAARAGEAGAGFAVVANEVKELAKQTATATEDISKRIEAIQVDTKSAVQAIKSISGIIDKVNSISSTIATAVEEQSATTAEMSRNLSEAAKGSGEVAQNINGVAQAAQNTSQGATDSLKAARSLAEMSTQLRELVEQFKIDDRASGRGEQFRRPGSERERSSAQGAREEILATEH